MGPQSISGAPTAFFRSIPYGGMPCLALNLMCQTLLFSHGRPYPFRGVDGGELLGGERRRRGGKENCNWNVKWIKKLKKISPPRWKVLASKKLLLNNKTRSQKSQEEMRKIASHLLIVLSLLSQQRDIQFLSAHMSPHNKDIPSLLCIEMGICCWLLVNGI